MYLNIYILTAAIKVKAEATLTIVGMILNVLAWKRLICIKSMHYITCALMS